MARKSAFVDHDSCGVGFIAKLGGLGSHAVLDIAFEALRRLGHRGGVDADGRSGDGAGLLTAIPENFFRKEAKAAGIQLPSQFGVGTIFALATEIDATYLLFDHLTTECGLKLLGWRSVPTDPSIIGQQALRTMPEIRQCFIAASEPTENLESKLFAFRKRVELRAPRDVYCCSLSSRTVVYKGLLTPEQLTAFYPDLSDPEFISSFAIFHQRYSTNTRPAWSLAQPFRFVAHNGEINTISANRRWLEGKKVSLLRELELPPEVRLLEQGVSDSASLDNAYEILLRRGYSANAAMMCMLPPAWESDRSLPRELRRFLEAHAYAQEPWDGPAAMIFTDGRSVGAKLDRNGLRPLRYTLTSHGLLVVGSESGIADLPEDRVIERQRLGPGEMLIAEPTKGLFLGPKQVRERADWHLRTPYAAPARITASGPEIDTPAASSSVMAALGWSEDQHRILFQPLLETGQDAVWSMGDDAAPAFLSNMSRPLWDYCKQRFAQVTNPPIDPLRETHVMSLDVYFGDRVVLSSPLLDSSGFEALQKEIPLLGRVDFTFLAAAGVEAAVAALVWLDEKASSFANSNPGFVLLSDRAVSEERAALPALLALAATWKSMVKNDAWNVPLVIETGQVVDTHHVALLIACGASAVLPYVAFEQASACKADGALVYRQAVEKGLLKVMARMGISNIASYRNSQLFETIGLDDDVCDEFFEGAGRALGGKGLHDLLADCLRRHMAAFAGENSAMRDEGLYRFRHNAERHATSPEVVRRMHRYIKEPTGANFKAYTELAEKREPMAVRDLLEVVPGEPVSLSEVEPEAAVLGRFSSQAMSLGAISPETHRTLAVAMNRLGARSNTGEGGEDPAVYTAGWEMNNRVKQVASARFGVTTEYLVRAEELEIKIAQGAKPGEGGQLPAKKVTAYIAALRHSAPNMPLISPPPHHDIYSIEDLAQLIYDLRAVNPLARVGVKLVSSTVVGIVATGVAKAGAGIITISGHDGGTGASPLTSIKNTGMPWEVGLRDTHVSLLRAGLRRRVKLRADGGFKSGRDVILAALLGADEFGFGTAALLALGCVMARQCHLNTCPVGIATQDEKFRARFTGKPEMVESFFRAVAREVRELLAKMGARSIDEIVGDVGRLRPRAEEAGRSVSELLEPLTPPPQNGWTQEFDGALQSELNCTLGEALPETVRSYRFAINTSDRAIGAHLSGEILRRGKSSGSIQAQYEFTGVAGQSFGAFLIPRIHLRLVGEANDYVGKGMSGGSIAITAGPTASLRGDVLIGNTVLYGATGGELFVAGRAGERFAVRNSGALAVIEGVGQHGCEYMTAGVALVLGPAGINFGAGMTGGLAYLLPDAATAAICNEQSVRTVVIEIQEEIWLRHILRRHLQVTGSPRAARLLKTERALPFLRVEPVAPARSVAETWDPILRNVAQWSQEHNLTPGVTLRAPLSAGRSPSQIWNE
jgi:glutamate synthase (ferredoxin)